jgi:hypothetical protein
MSDTAAAEVTSTPEQEAAARQATFHDHIISKLRGRIGDLEVEMAAMQVRYEYLVAEVEQERQHGHSHPHPAPSGAPANLHPVPPIPGEDEEDS